MTGNVISHRNTFTDSDARLKTDVQRITGALDRVAAPKGYTFTRGGERATGVIAQEVRDVLPEAVREGPGGVLGVAYGTMVGLLIEAVNELRARVDASAGAG